MTDQQWATKLSFKWWEWINLTGQLQIFLKPLQNKRAGGRVHAQICVPQNCMLSRCLIIDVCQGECTDIRIQTPPPKTSVARKPRMKAKALHLADTRQTHAYSFSRAHTHNICSHTHIHAKAHMQKKTCKHAHAYRCSHVCSGAVVVHILTHKHKQASAAVLILSPLDTHAHPNTQSPTCPVISLHWPSYESRWCFCNRAWKLSFGVQRVGLQTHNNKSSRGWLHRSFPLKLSYWVCFKDFGDFKKVSNCF